MYDAHRKMKFDLQGVVYKDPAWLWKAVLSSTLGFIAALVLTLRVRHLRVRARLVFVATMQAAVSGAIYLITFPFFSYLHFADWIALAFYVPSLCVMTAIVLTHVFEFVELFWEGQLTRTFRAQSLSDDAIQPFVSVHLACCNEPPEMVFATLRSLARLDYRNFEVLVIDNNTRDPNLWQPVQRFVDTLPAHFRFFHLQDWPGYKAGALNYALENADARADIIAVVDADYEVRRDWLRGLVGLFAARQVAVVQAPQAHREWHGNAFRTMMNWEYEGFFRIGMHHRNERNAIIQHGTMTMIRADALRKCGGWDEACVCEDSELGLRLMRAGYETVYVDEVVGRGLTPDSFAGFKKQRKRWAEGAMQILKKHSRALLTDRSLTAAQRYHFVAGWLPWIGDALHLFFVLAAIAWTYAALVAPEIFTLPAALILVPVVTFLVAKLVIGPILYRRRVPCSWHEVVGASIAVCRSRTRRLGVCLLGLRDPAPDLKSLTRDSTNGDGHLFVPTAQFGRSYC
jgi:glycosyltransferase involved in cell wall biosynthesis